MKLSALALSYGLPRRLIEITAPWLASSSTYARMPRLIQTLRGRFRDVLRVKGRRRAVPARVAGAAGKARSEAQRGQDAVDRILALCRLEPEGAREGKAGDLRLFGLHVYLREEFPDGLFRSEAQDGGETYVAEAARNQATTAAADARPDCANRGMARVGGARLFSIPCDSGQSRQAACISNQCGEVLAARDRAPQSDGRAGLEKDVSAGPTLHLHGACCSSVSERAF